MLKRWLVKPDGMSGNKTLTSKMLRKLCENKRRRIRSRDRIVSVPPMRLPGITIPVKLGTSLSNKLKL